MTLKLGVGGDLIFKNLNQSLSERSKELWATLSMILTSTHVIQRSVINVVIIYIYSHANTMRSQLTPGLNLLLKFQI